MRTENHATELRRYVLGTAAEEEAAAIEREYFVSVQALDRVRAAENDLIDDYVSGQLSENEHQAFERHYLTTRAHARRVAVACALGAAATAWSGERRRRIVWWRTAALAAALVLVAGGGALIRRGTPDPGTALGSPAVPTPQPSPAPATDRNGEDPLRSSRASPTGKTAPVVVALTISPILVRGAHAPAATIASGTDVVRLRLQGGPSRQRANPTTAVVRTVAGGAIWQGPAVSAQAEELARVDIPGARLRPDDYIVELLGIDSAGRTIELHRYFLSVRAP